MNTNFHVKRTPGTVDNQGPRTDNSHPAKCSAMRGEHSASVAQLDRVPGYEPGGREFDKFAGSEFRMRLRLRSEPERVEGRMPGIISPEEERC
jgi:hypothetical protein